LKALLENYFEPSIVFLKDSSASLLAKEKSYTVIYKAFLAKGLFEKYISKLSYKSFSLILKRDYSKSNFYLYYANKNLWPFHIDFLWKVVLIMKTCLLLFCMVVLNFRNLAKLVWIDLDQI
jgi:hypothetical protein